MHTPRARVLGRSIGVLTAASLVVGAGLLHASPPVASTTTAAPRAVELLQGPWAESWPELRDAVRRTSAPADASRSFAVLWRQLDVEGVFNVGRTERELRSILGSPDDERRERLGSRELTRLEYGYMAIDLQDGHLAAVLDLRGLTPETVTERDQVQLELDGRSWRPGYRQFDRTQALTEYVLPNESVQKWRELVSVQGLNGLAARGITVRSCMDHMKASFGEGVPGGSWAVLHESPDDLVYEFVVPAGAGQPAQHEVARLVRGRRDICRIAFTRRGGRMTVDLRDEWVARLRATEVVPAAQSRADARP